MAGIPPDSGLSQRKSSLSYKTSLPLQTVPAVQFIILKVVPYSALESVGKVNPSLISQTF